MTKEMRVQSACDEVAGTVHQTVPRTTSPSCPRRAVARCASPCRRVIDNKHLPDIGV